MVNPEGGSLRDECFYIITYKVRDWLITSTFLAHCFHGYNKHVFMVSPQELYDSKHIMNMTLQGGTVSHIQYFVYLSNCIAIIFITCCYAVAKVYRVISILLLYLLKVDELQDRCM